MEVKLRPLVQLPHLFVLPTIQCTKCGYTQRVFHSPDKVWRITEVHTGVCPHFSESGKEHTITIQPMSGEEPK